MTNYSERLDEVLDSGIENIQDGVTLALRAGQNIDYHTFDARVELKQALTSLTKELVADAKPNDYVPDGHEPDACLKHEKYTSSCCGCQRQRARNYALGEFEQNLLKELEDK